MLDKPTGLSSAQATARIKRLYQADRAGHAGTLDPLASGLLAVALGSSTRWCAYLLDAPKTYRFSVRLGQETDSQDAEGLEHARPPALVPAMTRADVEALLRRFTGVIRQRPPMHSAVKVGGQRLYKLAREGKTVERPHREVTIEQLTLLEVREAEWELEVRCSKGTYVRTLGHDLGQAVGCGAYVSALRRTGLGGFGEAQAVTMEQLEADSEEARLGRLLPADAGLPDWPSHECQPNEERALRCGQAIADSAATGWVKLRDAHGEFFGVAEAHGDGWLRPRRLMQDSSSGASGGHPV